MSSSFAFQGQGNVFNVTTNATPSTASAQVVSFAPIAVQPAAQATGITPSAPPQVRVVNTGTSIVYMSFTSAAHTAVIPTGGTPSIDFPVMPGEDVVFTLTQQPQPNQTTALNLILNINTVSTGASQVLNVQFGEGV